MSLKETDRKTLEDAVERLRADINDLASQLPDWNNENTTGTKKYRPIAKRILDSARRLNELVREHTYTR
jgi:hypothetical protein